MNGRKANGTIIVGTRDQKVAGKTIIGRSFTAGGENRGLQSTSAMQKSRPQASKKLWSRKKMNMHKHGHLDFWQR